MKITDRIEKQMKQAIRNAHEKGWRIDRASFGDCHEKRACALTALLVDSPKIQRLEQGLDVFCIFQWLAQYGIREMCCKWFIYGFDGHKPSRKISRVAYLQWFKLGRKMYKWVSENKFNTQPKFEDVFGPPTPILFDSVFGNASATVKVP